MRAVVAVPPGVGDVYWCLTKLEAFRKHVGVTHLTLAMQKCSLDRALDWSKMVDFVDATTTLPFRETAAMRKGFATDVKGAHYVMWPNAVVDAGKRLETWMPDLAYNDRFEIKTVPTRPPGDVVLFAGHTGINRNWYKDQPDGFWIKMAKGLERDFGRKPLLIGSYWDEEWCKPLEPHVEYHVSKTTLPEVADILKHARIVVGCASGMIILATHFRTPTVSFFPDKHHADFPVSWVAADAPYDYFWNRDLPRGAEPILEAARAIARPEALREAV